MIKIPMEESQEVGEKDGEVREKGIDLVNPKMEEKVKGLELGDETIDWGIPIVICTAS